VKIVEKMLKRNVLDPLHKASILSLIFTGTYWPQFGQVIEAYTVD
jgi:hypothetical protein